MNRGYYTNGLKTWMSDLEKRRDMLVARYRRMEKMNHPSADDQLLLLDLNKRMIDMVGEALTDAELQQRAQTSGE